jgi:hypothetical protein
MKAFVCVSLMCCATAFTQQVAQISGTVTDQSGAVIPEVTLTVTQNATGLKRAATSDSKGIYIMPDLPLGPWNLQATKMGFQTYVRPDVVLQVGTNPEIPVSLRVGDVAQQVIVEGTTSELETRTAGVGTTVMDTPKILGLPLNGRQILTSERACRCPFPMLCRSSGSRPARRRHRAEAIPEP